MQEYPQVRKTGSSSSCCLFVIKLKYHSGLDLMYQALQIDPKEGYQLVICLECFETILLEDLPMLSLWTYLLYIHVDSWEAGCLFRSNQKTNHRLFFPTTWTLPEGNLQGKNFPHFQYCLFVYWGNLCFLPI